MKTRLIIIALLTLIPSIIYCQNEASEDNNFHFIEGGFGAGYSRSVHGAVNVGLTNSIGKYMANFIDYNMAFGKSQTLFHEFNFKMGPYWRFGQYSYIAVSSGVSLMRNTPMVEYNYSSLYFYQTYSEGDFLINIPIQAKMNIGVYKGACIGIKGTYNKMIDKGIESKGTVLMYLAYGW